MPGQNRILFLTKPVLGLISLVMLIGYFLALNDIWHELGRPDFWAGLSGNKESARMRIK